jgi:hypothetical protein
MGRETLDMRFLAELLFIVVVCNLMATQTDQAIDPAANLKDFQVIEFRRYTIKPGGRENFTKYFETYFPGAIEQVGSIIAGSFLERKNQDGFTWIRGFHTIDDRATANAAFYAGPVWKEHRKTANDLIADSDNVMLLRPWRAERDIPILPDVDPVTEANGAQGLLVAQIFAVKADSVQAFTKEAETEFAAYQAAGAREAGVFVTLDVKNNYPQLPVRTDGPYLVWLGILKDNQMLETEFTPVAERSLQSFSATGLLRGAPELIVMDPTPRSRLRWLP